MTLPTSGWEYTGEGDNITTYQNKWRWDKYEQIVDYRAYVHLEDFNGKIVQETQYYADGSIGWNSSDISSNYSAIVTSYIYCLESFDITISFGTDDAGTLYVNGQQVAQSNVSLTNASISLKKGENIFQICYTEGSGGDGWTVTPALYALDKVLMMSAERIGYYSQTVTPIKLKATQPDITRNSLVQGFNPIKNDALTINKNSDIKDMCNKLIIIPNEDGSVTVYKNYDIFDTDVSGYLSIINK